MTAKSHNVIAFAALLTAAVYAPPQSLNFLTLFAAVVGNIVGSLSPDLDQASNRLWDLMPGGDMFGRIFRPVFMGHRSLSHSFIGLTIYFYGLAWLLPRILNPDYVYIKIVLVSTVIGFISHLASDAVTEEGLPLFFPNKIKIGFPPIQSWRMKTGKWFENLIVFPSTIAYIIWFVTVNRQDLVNILRLVHN